MADSDVFRRLLRDSHGSKFAVIFRIATKGQHAAIRPARFEYIYRRACIFSRNVPLPVSQFQKKRSKMLNHFSIIFFTFWKTVKQNARVCFYRGMSAV